MLQIFDRSSEVSICWYDSFSQPSSALPPFSPRSRGSRHGDDLRGAEPLSERTPLHSRVVHKVAVPALGRQDRTDNNAILDLDAANGVDVGRARIRAGDTKRAKRRATQEANRSMARGLQVMEYTSLSAQSAVVAKNGTSSGTRDQVVARVANGASIADMHCTINFIAVEALHVHGNLTDNDRLRACQTRCTRPRRLLRAAIAQVTVCSAIARIAGRTAIARAVVAGSRIMRCKVIANT